MQGYCQSCYIYFITENKTTHPLPEYGKQTFAPNGDCICPFCGKAFRKLGGHLRYAHGMTAKEAYEKAGWDHEPHASNKDYRNTMRKRLWTKCVVDNLLKKGKTTRFTKGNVPKKKYISQMTINRIRNNKKKNTNPINQGTKNIQYFTASGIRIK